jgi:endonuclease YncB( thermonuclease family)
VIYGPYPAQVDRVYDGDTFWANVDLGFGLILHVKVRLYGINAPELHAPGGPQSRDYLIALLAKSSNIHISSVGWDNYGARIDGTVWVEDVNVNAAMLQAGQAVKYP